MSLNVLSVPLCAPMFMAMLIVLDMSHIKFKLREGAGNGLLDGSRGRVVKAID